MILDTNALSAFADGDHGLLNALGGSELHVPVIVLGEYRYGILRSRYRSEYDAWLREALSVLSPLPVTDSTTPHYAALCDRLRNAGTPIPTNDAWIAAIAIEQGMAVVSKDAHFDLVTGVTRIGW
jgi:predicted nucleic acid-binding protein